jgi:hypothetical protein
MAKDLQLNLLMETADAATKVSDIRREIKALKSAAIELGEGTQGWAELIAKAGQLNSKLLETNAAVKALSGPNGLSNLARGMGEVGHAGVGAFQGIAGAMVLVGDKNEDLTKSIQQLMGLMALANGLKAFSTMGRDARDFALVLDNIIGKTATHTAAVTAGAGATTAAAAATGVFSTALKTVQASMGPIIIAIGAVITILVALGSAHNAAAKEAQAEFEVAQNSYDLMGKIYDQEIRIQKIRHEDTTAKELEKYHAQLKNIDETEKKLYKTVHDRHFNTIHSAADLNGDLSTFNKQELEDYRKLQSDKLKLYNDFSTGVEEAAQKLKEKAEKDAKKAEEDAKKAEEDAKKATEAYIKSQETKLEVDKDLLDSQLKNQDEGSDEYLKKENEISQKELQIKIASGKYTADEIKKLQEAELNNEIANGKKLDEFNEKNGNEKVVKEKETATKISEALKELHTKQSEDDKQRTEKDYNDDKSAAEKFAADQLEIVAKSNETQRQKAEEIYKIKKKLLDDLLQDEKDHGKDTGATQKAAADLDITYEKEKTKAIFAEIEKREKQAETAIKDIMAIQKNADATRIADDTNATNQEIANSRNQANAQLANLNSNSAQAKKIKADEAANEKSLKDQLKAQETAIKKKEFEEDKALKTVQAVMSVAGAIAKALPDPVLAALAGAMGAIQIATITSQQFNDTSASSADIPSMDTSSSSSSGASSTPNLNLLGYGNSGKNSFGSGNGNNSSQNGGGPIQAYVVESDISNTQNRVNKYKSESSI